MHCSTAASAADGCYGDCTAATHGASTRRATGRSHSLETQLTQARPDREMKYFKLLYLWYTIKSGHLDTELANRIFLGDMNILIFVHMRFFFKCSALCVQSESIFALRLFA